MIDPEDRFYAGLSCILKGGPHTWHFTDFDLRRCIAVVYSPTPPTDDERLSHDLCLTQLRRHANELPPDVTQITFTEPNGPITISTDLEDDVTQYINYRPLSELKLPSSINVIYMSSLTELDRIAPQIDKVSYESIPADGEPLPASKTIAAFKYWLMPTGMPYYWYEMRSWSQLPRNHPHIVPFDAVVLNDIGHGVVGFTSIFIEGGTLLERNATMRPFKLKWLSQLCDVVDYLNFELGIMHEDIASKNLIIDEHDNLRIFDFNYCTMVGREYAAERDDIKGVVFTLYEIITLDGHFREVPCEEQNIDAVLNIEWTKHPDVQLDRPVHDFRQILDAWVHVRSARDFVPKDTWITWSTMGPAPETRIPNIGLGTLGKEKMKTNYTSRRNLETFGVPYFRWERPPSCTMMTNTNFRANGMSNRVHASGQ